jgi:hypothetical protein
MTRDIELACRCGAVHGWVRGVSPRTVNRAVCHCDDCQSFAHHIGRTDLLDEHAGTDIVQVAPASVNYDRGLENIVGLRLGPKGMHRWYASCCKTPLGNTMATPGLPFIGMSLEVFHGVTSEPQREEVFGEPRGRVFGQYATNGAPEGSTKLPPALVFNTLRLLAGWKLGGKTWPHPFFDRERQVPRYPVKVLSFDERSALRSRCGPNPAGAQG